MTANDATASTGLPARCALRLVAVLSGLIFLYALTRYPLRATWLVPVLAAYVGWLCWRPQSWLVILTPLLVALDLAPWTGWFFFEEIDLFLLATVALAYWRWAFLAPTLRLSTPALVCVAGFTIAHIIAVWHGLAPLATWSGSALNARDNYLSPYNSLRAGKPWLWALLLLPLLQRMPTVLKMPDHTPLDAAFIPGLLFGLALVASACLWERLVFPGLLNFSSDYRISAPFSAMHTGGAALDGFLALTFPLCLNCLARLRGEPGTGFLLGLLLLAAYAGLATFSRGLFAAYGVSTLLLIALHGARRVATGVLGWRRLLLGTGLAILLIYGGGQMFAASGYRGLAAAVVLLGAAGILSALPTPWRRFPAILVCSIALESVLVSLPGFGSVAPTGILKLPYLLFGVSCASFGGALALLLRRAHQQEVRPATGAPLSLALLAFAGLAINTVWIAVHWAGRSGVEPAGLVVLLAALVVGVNARVRPRLWQPSRASVPLALAGVLVLTVAIPVCAGYYTSVRFATSSGDLALRLRHWRQTLNMMDDSLMTALFGQGLGRFPVTYFWRNQLGETPPTIQYLQQDGTGYVRLTGGHYAQGYGEVLRLLQRITVQPHTPYLLNFSARLGSQKARLHVRLCQRLLLYPQNCLTVATNALAADGHWHAIRTTIDSATLGSGAWLWRAPVQLELAAEGQSAPIDIAGISLHDLDADELIRNGQFSQANDYWFFSSDRHHLPWHIKNLPLNVYFDMGWLGLLSLGGLIVSAMTLLVARAWRRTCRPGTNGAAAACALAGFLLVGLFDSLLDVPRLALLFYLMLLLAVLTPRTAPAPSRHSPVITA